MSPRSGGDGDRGQQLLDPIKASPTTVSIAGFRVSGRDLDCRRLFVLPAYAYGSGSTVIRVAVMVARSPLAVRFPFESN
jgi:hypothetical protein